MMPWRLVLLVTLYVALDVANPLMPGAVVFDADASVELRQAGRFGAGDSVRAPIATPARADASSDVATPPTSTRLLPRATRPHTTRPRVLPPPRHSCRDDEPPPPSVRLT